MKTIETSLDWPKIRTEYLSEIKNAPLNCVGDLHKMLSAIDSLVNELSKDEVELRRKRNSWKAAETKTKVNELINSLDGYITMSCFMGNF